MCAEEQWLDGISGRMLKIAMADSMVHSMPGEWSYVEVMMKLC